MEFDTKRKSYGIKYGKVSEAEVAGERHFGDAELCDAITATDCRSLRPIDHRTAARFPHVEHLVEVLALNGLDCHEDRHCHVLVRIAQCHV